VEVKTGGAGQGVNEKGGAGVVQGLAFYAKVVALPGIPVALDLIRNAFNEK
jgi:hypothetical protein